MGVKNGSESVNFASGFSPHCSVKVQKSKHKQLCQMVHFKNILIPFVAVFFLLMAGCSHDSTAMQELTRIDSMVYHQGERDALPILQ